MLRNAAAPKKSFRMQDQNDSSFSSRNTNHMNSLSFISPFNIHHDLKKKQESQHETEETPKGTSSAPQKNYKKREPFDFTNYIQATAPTSPILYHNQQHKDQDGIPFTFGTTSEDSAINDPAATPFPTPATKSMLDSEPHMPIRYQTKNTIPFVSMDHDRRKRRRMTMEDAFANVLSMNHNTDDDDYGLHDTTTHEIDPTIKSSPSVDWIMTPERDVFTPPTATAASMSTPPMDPAAYIQEHPNVEYPNISKKLEFSEGMTIEVGPSLSTMKNNTMYRQTSNDTNFDNVDLSSDVDDLAMSDVNNYEDDNYTEASASSTTSSSNHSNGLSLLFAPRKHKGQNTKPVDPVDERIEELIRHSRIKAMMMSNREKKRDLQQRGQRYKSGAVSSSMEHDDHHDDDTVVSSLFGQKRKNYHMEYHQGHCDDSYSNRYYNDGSHKPHPLTGKVLSFDVNPISETKTI